ncbi:3-oxoacyl-[acyl-carrier-protein] synthase 3 [Candidatus Westeberhardia cardiocondylae]|uniref:3-oxoacyl-[acyl-carrier-protein] synthase 3 n=2 Tax=Candidatus Westeberhardia cardiocondylae TaxID=1594731 RepID=A0A0H5BX49_9ENTR|nr:3-oxoacyl-[acyl-carrier-protein] synthase 3 [Candidatus Westeberhardia cardiocondylae]
MLSVVDNYIKNNVTKYVLFIESNTISQILDPNDRDTLILFRIDLSTVQVNPITEYFSIYLHVNGKCNKILTLLYYKAY